MGSKSSAVLFLIKYLLLVLKVIVINTILFTVKTCAISSTTGSAIIVSTNSNTNELNTNISRSVALSLTQNQIVLFKNDDQPLQQQQLLLLQEPQQTTDSDTYYGFSDLQSVAGGKVSIPCNTSVWGENEVSLVLWYRDGTGIPIYRVDARNNPLSKSKHSPADELAKRFYFDTSVTPPVLKIFPVMAHDQGEYRCRVDYRASRTQNVIVQLNVTVPPKEVLIMDMEGQRLEGLIGPYDEDSDVLLICEAEGGRPTPSVIWLHGSKLVDESYTTGPHGLVRNELNLKQLNRSDFMSILTCRAFNTNMTEPVVSSVILDMNLKPLNVLIVTPIVTPLVAGIRTEMQCRSTGSRPSAQISWWKGLQRLNNVRDSVINDGNTTSSTVSFVPAIEDHGKALSCRADNLPMPHSALDDSRILNVQFPPQIHLNLGANIQKDNIREGSDVYFECHIKANPWIKEVLWLFNNKSLLTSQSSGIIVTNQSLVLQKVRRQHRGRYQCKASNNEGDSYSDTIDLKVNFAPVCKTGQKHQYGVGRNEPARIKCEVDSEPKDRLQFKWFVNTSAAAGGNSATDPGIIGVVGPDLIDLKDITVNYTTSIATYTPTNRFSYGQLLCYAQNELGKQLQPCVYNIVPAGPPEPVRNCIIANHSMTTLLVDCTAGDDGGLHQHFCLEVYSSSTQQLLSNLSSTHPAFTVSNLMAGAQFTLVVYAVNAKGRSHTVSLNAATLSPPEKHISNGSFEQIVINPILGILIAIVASIVLIVIIIIIVIKLRSNHYDKRNGNKPNKGLNLNSTGMLDNSRNSLHVDPIDECDQQIKEFVDVVTSINEQGLTNSDLTCNGLQLNALKQLKNNCTRNNDSNNAYKKIANYNQYCTGPITKSPPNEITYAELTLSQVGVNSANSSVSPISSSMRRCSIGPIDPMTQYAQIDFQRQINGQSLSPNRVECIKQSPSSPANSSSPCLLTQMCPRESPIADGCSETEATIETPLMEPQYRPQEIRINKEVHRLSRSGATPV